MKKTIIFHGSSEIVETPIWGAGKTYNDYGKGFYCTEHLELAKEWACTEGTDGYVNQYQLNLQDLQILDLLDEKYTILHWIALLVTYRQFRLSTPLMKRGVQWLTQEFLIDIEPYDVIIGYRADDSYFSFARAFLNNEISLSQLNYAMKLGKLGNQIVLKSPKAFEILRFLSYETVDHTVYYAKRKDRDETARASYLKELEKDDIDGIYLRDMIREGMKVDDVRLQSELFR